MLSSDGSSDVCSSDLSEAIQGDTAPLWIASSPSAPRNDKDIYTATACPPAPAPFHSRIAKPSTAKACATTTTMPRPVICAAKVATTAKLAATQPRLDRKSTRLNSSH